MMHRMLFDQLIESQDRLINGVHAGGVQIGEPDYRIWYAALKPIFTELLGGPRPIGNQGVEGSTSRC